MAIVLQLHDIQLYNQGFVLFGRDSTGKGVSVRVEEEVETYFYLRLREGDLDTNKMMLLKKQLCNDLASRLKWVCGKNGEKCNAMQCDCNPDVFVKNEFGPDLVPMCIIYMRDIRLPNLVTSVTPVKGRSIIGYESEESDFARVAVHSYGVLRMVKAIFTRKKDKNGREIPNKMLDTWEPFELGIEPITRFMADLNVVGGGFVQVDKFEVVEDDEKRTTRSELELKVVSSGVQPIAVKAANYPLRMVSFDIECCSFKPNCFPTAGRGDPVIQIGIVAETLFDLSGSSVKNRSVVFCLADTAAIPTGEIVSFKSEGELLAAFFEYVIVEFGADVVTGYNSNQFDMPYILERAAMLGLKQYHHFSKMTARSMRYWKQTFESAQAGARVTVQYNTPGLVMFDVFNYVKKTMNLRSYSLNNVAIAVLKDEKKDDMKYSDIPIFQQQSPEKRAIIAKYCLQDTVLVSRLIHVRKMLVNNIEFSRICGVLLQHSIEKGVSFKILRKVLQYTIQDRYFIPTFQRNVDGEQIVPYYSSIVNPLAQYQRRDENRMKQLLLRDMFSGVKRSKTQGQVQNTEEPRLKFQGAFVLEPKSGFHTDIVATLDFASLYPGEMRMHNMCPSTLLQSHAQAAALGLVQGTDYEEVASGFLFVRKSTREGLLPRIETELHAERKAAKAQLKAAKQQGNAMLSSVYDGKQLAIKLVMNSIYGFMGSRTSAVTALPIAVSITAQGRHDIMATKNWVEQHFRRDFCKDAPGNANVVYGDSVIGETPLLIKYGRSVHVLNILDLVQRFGAKGQTWVRTRGGCKESFEMMDNVRSWSDGGWTLVGRVVRHLCQKDLVQVCTSLGVVVCTTDHSLVCENGREIMPNECVVGNTRLLHHKPVVNRRFVHDIGFGGVWIRLDVEFARILGMYTGAGVCGSNWEISHGNVALLDKYRLVLNRLFCPRLKFVRKGHVLSVVKGPTTSKFLDEWYEFCHFLDGEKKVPTEMYTSRVTVQRAFLTGIRESGEKHLLGYRICQGVTTLAYLSGLENVVVYGSTSGANTVVKKIILYPREEQRMYVYDLTTQNHHFQAGLGTMIVHNTDSVMVKFEGTRDLAKGFEYAEEIERRINSLEVEDGVAGLFQMPMYLEFEKVFWPYYLLKKKKYLAMKYDAGELDKPPKVDVKGIEMIRNNWAKLCTITQKRFIDILLIDKSKEKAVAYVRERVVDLMEGRVSNEELVLSRKLSKFTYKNKQPHVEVAKMLQRTDPMNAPALGDRVEYFIGLNEVVDKTADKAYPVSMFGKVDVDFKYYLEKQLLGPMQRVLEPLIGEVETKKVFTYARSAKRRKEQDKHAMERLFKKR